MTAANRVGGLGSAVVVLSVWGVVVQHASGDEERPAAAVTGRVGDADRGVRRRRGRGLGGRLAQAGTDVQLIDRGAHLQALREHGLRVHSVKGDFTVRVPATDDPVEVGPCDYVLFCMKAFDTEPAAARLGPLLGEGTAVLSLQNGVDNEDKLARAIGQDHVMGGAAFIFAGKAAPGVIVHTGGPTSITFGELDGRSASGRNGCWGAASGPGSPPSCQRASRRCCGPSSPFSVPRPA